ncbi:MAG TPA: MBL fold metallo-hydrolase [Solirubrobacterales bacterium]|nr:MBL fold metallo-hydrolase [Solirubrobacterales bacterium]
MRIHHLNCGTMCPRSARLINGEGGWLAPGKIVCHCLLIESGDGLLLVDTGVASMTEHRPLGRVFAPMRPINDRAETALAQIEALGYSASDVRHLVMTHLDGDHTGGLRDFPEADVHVFAPELAAALEPELRDRARYGDANWEHGPRWVRHEVDDEQWFGFESARILPELDFEMRLVPLVGHTRGHSGVAIEMGDGWLLHCGDACFHHGDRAIPPYCPAGLRAFQRLAAADNGSRVASQERLRELAARRDDVRMFCSHDPHDLEVAQAAAAAAT